MNSFATVQDLIDLWRPLTNEETERAEQLLPIISDVLRQYAFNYGQELDGMIAKGQVLEAVVKSVTVDVVARTLLTSTEDEPMTQYSQSALGYSVSGSYLIPGGGLFIKDSELRRLGLKKQKYGVIDFYEQNQGNNSNSI